jgi:4-diphosphocytidyl-2-C-methyl-D-erythritol kinase
MHLHKQIPVGAGLGGGSSNAATVLTMLNELFGKLFNDNDLRNLAAELGSDCPFFIHPSPMLMEGRGEKLSRLNIHFNGIYIVIINPGLHISTAYAYQKVKPCGEAYSLPDLIRLPPDTWKDNILNDFESPIFSEFSGLSDLKNKLYETGAIYSSMSGSGSSIYGMYRESPQLPATIADTIVWKGELKEFRQIQ